jgi:hypothetical protein
VSYLRVRFLVRLTRQVVVDFILDVRTQLQNVKAKSLGLLMLETNISLRVICFTEFFVIDKLEEFA